MEESLYSKQSEILTSLIAKHKSLREFARVISEDSSDVLRWRDKKVAIQPRAVITIVQLFGVSPHDLRPDVFPPNTKITFT